MKRSQWSLLFFGALFLACLLHVKFCEWASGARAADLGLESLIRFGADAELTWGLYSNQAELSFTAAFLCGVVLPLGFLAAAAFLLLARPRPRIRPQRTLVEDLQTGDTAARATPAGTLASPGTRAAEGAGALSRALRDSNVKVQAEAAEALADIGPEAGEAVPDLVRELTSSDAAVRQTCARAGQDRPPGRRLDSGPEGSPQRRVRGRPTAGRRGDRTHPRRMRASRHGRAHGGTIG